MKKTLILLLIILSVSCRKENEYFVNLTIDGVTGYIGSNCASDIGLLVPVISV